MENVVVTGGGTGIGRAVAAWFAARGDAVTIVGRRTEVLRGTADRLGVTPLVCDLTDPHAVAGALPRFPDQVDVLVNNAGGIVRADADAAAEADADREAARLGGVARDWQNNFAANVLTAVLTTTAMDDRLTAGGRVITIGSIASRKGAGSYGAAKAALEAWNRTVAASLGPRGITANIVAPGLVLDTEFFGDRLSDERRSRLVAETHTGRAGEPADIAAAVGFLASAEARHITAQVVHVNGGAYASG